MPAHKINPDLVIKRSPHRPAFLGGNRVKLDKYIDNLPKGTLVESGVLSKMFNLSSGGTVGGYLKQRDDVERQRGGRWKKV